MAAAVPVVEVADDTDALRVGRPDREVDPVGRADAHRMRAELLVNAGVIALAEEIHIEVGENAAEAKRVVDLDLAPARVEGSQAIVRDLRQAFEPRFEHAGRMTALHRHRVAAHPCDHVHPFRTRQDRAHHDAAIEDVGPEHRERIRMTAVHQQGQRIDGAGHGRVHGSAASSPGRSPATRARGTIHSDRSASSGRSPGPPSDVTPAA